MHRRCTLVLGLVLGGCNLLVGGEPLTAVGPDARPDAADHPAPDAPMVGCDQLDVLFVIDSSASMGAELKSLGTNFPKLVQALDAMVGPTGAALDYHLGITTGSRDLTYTTPVAGGMLATQVDHGDNGALRGGCNNPRAWLERTDPSVQTAAACRVDVGALGPSEVMSFEATRLATSARALSGGPNAGFLRPTAPLVVVVVSDEDDCSRTDDNVATTDGDPCVAAQLAPVADYRAYLDQLKGGHDRWSMAIVANPGATECGTLFGTALPGLRLQGLATASPDNVALTSICNTSVPDALAAVVTTVRAQCAR
jgi:hypothetical protein